MKAPSPGSVGVGYTVVSDKTFNFIVFRFDNLGAPMPGTPIATVLPGNLVSDLNENPARELQSNKPVS